MLVKVPLYVCFKLRGCGYDFLRGESAFGCRFGGWDVGGLGCTCDVGNDVVNADRFSGGKGAEGYNHLRHSVRRRIFARIFAEFLDRSVIVHCLKRMRLTV